jgi:uncharacterized protein (DUF2235 family)
VKNIVFCADGTWDKPHDPMTVSGNDTNVYKLFKALLMSATQFPKYDDGVGADGTPIDQLAGGAFGIGLFQKIKDGYTALAQLYEQDDQIFIFGFSRGAYTARSVAGMVAVCGLPTKDFDNKMVDVAFQAYRDKLNRAALLASLSSYSLYDAKIKMLGVWDTVGSLGIPGALLGLNKLDPIYGFLDTSLHPDVLNAYQALAIDERREEFQPTLWTSQPAPGQVMEQAWFAGAHSDVGGGYPEHGLSDITLGWIMKNAIACGLEVDPDAAAPYLNIEAKHALDQVHESWNVLWAFPVRRNIPAAATIANSVDIRLAQESNYGPPNLKLNDRVLVAGYGSTQVVVLPEAQAAAV